MHTVLHFVAEEETSRTKVRERKKHTWTSAGKKKELEASHWKCSNGFFFCLFEGSVYEL